MVPLLRVEVALIRCFGSALSEWALADSEWNHHDTGLAECLFPIPLCSPAMLEWIGYGDT